MQFCKLLRTTADQAGLATLFLEIKMKESLINSNLAAHVGVPRQTIASAVERGAIPSRRVGVKSETLLVLVSDVVFWKKREWQK